MAQIEQIFFLPPSAIARLGGSDHPLDSYQWLEDPSLHGAGLTVIDPTVTLEIQPDGSVRPFLPASIQFRDGNLLRPVAPFLELWAQVQGSDDLQPLTTALLTQNGAALASVTYTATAANRKTSRRTGDDACTYQASVRVPGDDSQPHPMLASSIGQNPLVLPANPIPLGTFQVIRPTPNRTDLGVNLDTLRVRYTPAKGLVYGPPSATQAADPDLGDPSRIYELVPPANRILNPNASWMSYNADTSRFNNPEPGDTYDGADDDNRGNLSYGVVDDTCDVLIEASVVANNQRLTTTARVFSGPPDYAPDRRPFVTLADELIDRDPPSQEAAEELADALDRLADLFQRIFETASLANVDAMRSRALFRQPASQFPPATTAAQSMTPQDPLFDKSENLNSPPSTHEKLPYASIAQQVHGPLANADDLALFLRGNADKVRKLIRPPYGAFSELAITVQPGAAPNATHRDPRNIRDHLHDMRMPPYLRDADASPLSLGRRQYQFLMDMVSRLQTEADTISFAIDGGDAIPAPIATRVRSHVAQVFERRNR